MSCPMCLINFLFHDLTSHLMLHGITRTIILNRKYCIHADLSLVSQDKLQTTSKYDMMAIITQWSVSDNVLVLL